MQYPRVLRIAPLLAVAFGALTLSSSAAAASSNPFGCRASLSAVRPASPLPTIEPYVANRAETPCATDTAGASSGTALSSPGDGTVTAGPGAAYTYSTTSADPTTGAVAPGVAALASVQGGSLAGMGDSIVLPGPAEAQASYACTDGKLVPSASSTLSAVTINGKTTTLSSPGAAQTIALGGGAYVAFNQEVQTATSLTERLVDEHIPGVEDIVLGEAQVTQTAADPCAGTSGSGSGGSGSGGSGGSGSGGSGGSGSGGPGGLTPASLSACPPGSTLVASTQECEIVQPGGALIDVSPPFAGPTGGRVMALSVARKKYHSACLSGPGPKYAIVGTNRANRIEGTLHSDRILGLGGADRIAGRGGNDCIDGGAGNDRVWGGNGQDRVYGGLGNDRLSVQSGNSYVNGGAGNDAIFIGNGNDTVLGGPGNDRISVGRGQDKVSGGAGSDTITTGDGNDWVYGNAGNDSIKVGNGKDHVFGGAGADRLYAPGLVDYVNGGTGRDLAYVNTVGMRYAKAHSCEKVRKIRTHVL
jgi:Ca2+-binding RTX toxin-like protein